jgi:superfamily II DNA/RNA helicase
MRGQLAQGTRRTVLADFHTGRLQVLAASDLAARGLDIAGLPAVLNYALPRSAVAYTQRIGRTRRAGVAAACAARTRPRLRACCGTGGILRGGG